MIAHKFLHAGHTGLYSGFRWPVPKYGNPGDWVVAEGEIRPCFNGVHACLPDALIDWIDDELWLVELDGELFERDGVVVALRGRLLELLETWSDQTARSLIEACLTRLKASTIEALREAGFDHAAESLMTGDPKELEHRAAALAATDEERLPLALAYLLDSLALARGERPEAPCTWPLETTGPRTGAIAANIAYVTAVAAGQIEATTTGEKSSFERGFETERRAQRAWLAERLQL